MKQYDISFSFSITDSTVSYNTNKIISINITEKLPVNINPEKYLKQRLAEEVKRSFGNLVGEIENFTDEAKEAADPLDSGF